jgi:hypothetical protein
MYERMTIKANSGNVGIGTTTPTAKLNVVGNFDIVDPGSTPSGMRTGVSADGGRVWVEYNSSSTLPAPRLILSDYDDPPRILFRQAGSGSEDSPQYEAWIGMSQYLSNNLAIIADNVGIGTTTPSERLEVCGNAKVVGQIIANSSNLSAGVTCSSDIRYKKDITPLTNSLNNVMQLRGVYYFWKTKEFPEKQFPDARQIGFIAQELEKVYPEVVFTDKDGYKSVDYSRLTPILVEAIKEQQKIIQKQQEEINALNEKLNIVINTLSAEKKVGNK